MPARLANETARYARQFAYKEHDVGRKKVEVLAGELRGINSRVNVVALDRHIEKPADLDSLPAVDLMAVSADESWLLVRWVNSYCVRRRVPYVNIGYLGDIAIYGPFYIPGKGSCFECRQISSTIRDGSQARMVRVNSRARAPSCGPVNAIASGMASTDIFNFLGKFGTVAALNRRIGLYVGDMRLRYLDLPLNPDCHVCGDGRYGETGGPRLGN